VRDKSTTYQGTSSDITVLRQFCVLVSDTTVLLTSLARCTKLDTEVVVYRQEPRRGNCRYLFLLRGRKSTFCTIAEKLYVGSKNDCHLSEWARRPLASCKVWGDRTMVAGFRCEVWCFFCHAPSPARCSFEGTYFEQVLCHSLWSILMLFSPFLSEVIALSDAPYSSHFRRYV